MGEDLSSSLNYVSVALEILAIAYCYESRVLAGNGSNFPMLSEEQHGGPFPTLGMEIYETSLGSQDPCYSNYLRIGIEDLLWSWQGDMWMWGSRDICKSKQQRFVDLTRNL